MCQTRSVIGSFIEPILTVVGLLSMCVFVLAFKFAVREAAESHEHRFEPPLPRAALGVGRGPTWHRWRHSRRGAKLAKVARLAQSGVIAAGVTSVFIMFLCTAGVVATVLMR